jgi:hypothetical protein
MPAQMISCAVLVQEPEKVLCCPITYIPGGKITEPILPAEAAAAIARRAA